MTLPGTKEQFVSKSLEKHVTELAHERQRELCVKIEKEDLRAQALGG